jgi:alpha-galactosidase
VALFNLESVPETLQYSWKDVGLPETSYRLRDLWEHKDLATGESLTVTLAPHASVLYGVSSH